MGGWGLGVLEDFLDGGFAFENTAQAVGAERGHAELDCLLADDDGGRALSDELADRLGDVEQFVDALAAFVTGMVALLAAGAVVKILVADVVDGKPDLTQDRLARLVRRATAGADAPNEALPEHALEARGDQERLDAHIDETGNGAGCVIGVQRGEDKVTGERGLNGDLGGFQIARFTDHDAVRVLAQKGAQGAGESKANGLVDRHLLDALDLILNRLLGREQFRVGGIDAVEAGVKRGRLARAGRAGDDEDAVRLLDDLADVFVNPLRQPDGSEVELDRAAVENAEHDAFAELRGQRGDAQIDLATGHGRLDAAILRNTALGDVHLRHDLDARGDRRGQGARRGRHFVKRAVHAIANLEVVLERLEMNVARTRLDGLGQDGVDVLDDWR